MCYRLNITVTVLEILKGRLLFKKWEGNLLGDQKIGVFPYDFCDKPDCAIVEWRRGGFFCCSLQQDPHIVGNGMKYSILHFSEIM